MEGVESAGVAIRVCGGPVAEEGSCFAEGGQAGAVVSWRVAPATEVPAHSCGCSDFCLAVESQAVSRLPPRLGATAETDGFVAAATTPVGIGFPSGSTERVIAAGVL